MTGSMHAVVIGGGSGIGLAVAESLARSGRPVTIMGRDGARLAAAAAGIPGAREVVCDVVDETSVQSAFAAAGAAAGPVGILVNCAGIVRTASFEKTGDEDWDAMWRTNVMGAVHAARAVLPAMRELPSGRIIHVASTAALKAYAYVSAYTASKHALLGLTRALALELARTRITVNALCPGYTDTAIVRDAVATIVAKTGRSEADALATFTASNPQGRLVAPGDVAGAVEWLVSDAAQAVTGQTLVVAGGEIM